MNCKERQRPPEKVYGDTQVALLKFLTCTSRSWQRKHHRVSAQMKTKSSTHDNHISPFFITLTYSRPGGAQEEAYGSYIG